MNFRARIAHHEAAHIVVAIIVGAGITDHGIDLDAPTSAPGAFGRAGTNLFIPDPDLPKPEQMRALANNLAIVCAGAASDAKLTSITPAQALQMQNGDETVAKRLIAGSDLIDETEREREKEENYVLYEVGLAKAVELIDKPDVWEKIQRVAIACLSSGGRLSKEQIESIVLP